MKAATRLTLVVVTVLTVGSAAWAADVPWKRSDQDDAPAPATLEEIKAEVGQARYQRIVGPIESRMALAEKAMDPYNKEMEKPAKDRRAAMLQKCKVRSAQMHEAAAKAAVRAGHMLQKKSHRACIKEEFEKPNRRDAARIYLELSSAARLEGNIPQAAVLCKKALAADPQNAQARQLLKELAQEYQQAVRDRRNRSGNTGGGSSEDKKAWDWDRDSDHNRSWGDWRNYTGHGRGGWY
ncbi:MAG: hypothetical protein U9R68_01650 [Planctomycetota bacterium]|nr:hypothetical protein [Planctomycetota bacterium]